MTIAVLHPTGRANLTEVVLHGLTITFSYRTPIAFRLDGAPAVVRVNEWGNTTARHLAHADGGTTAAKARRIDGATFERELAEITAAMVPIAEQLAASLALVSV